MGKVSVVWLAGTVELLLKGEGWKEFVRDYEVCCKACIAQKCFNRLFSGFGSIWRWQSETFYSYWKVEKGRAGGAAEPSCERLSLSFSCPLEMELELSSRKPLGGFLWSGVGGSTSGKGRSNRVRAASGIWNNA